MPRIFFSIFLSFFVLLFLCCGTHEVTLESPQVNVVNPASEFVIILPENHKTGHVWQLLQNYDERIVEQINEVWHGNEKGIYFYLQAKDTGATTLSFISRKYRDTIAMKQFIINVKQR